MRHSRSALVFALFIALSPRVAEAQWSRPAPRALGSRGWAPPWAGVRAGWDYGRRATVLGAQLRVPAIPSGQLEIVPTGDVTFATGLREYQGGVDAVFVAGGRAGGFYGGVGLAWRNTVWDRSSRRETRTVPVTMAGIRSGLFPGAPFGVQLDMRWIWVDQPIKPRVLTMGINFPLW